MRRFLWTILAFGISTGLAARADDNGSAKPARKAPRKSLHDEFTGQQYGMAGCGLGSIVFADKPGMIQVIAATLNATGGNQTFAISSGTSNCGASGAKQDQAMLFLEVNHQALARDVSRGNGETLNSFAKLIGCDSAQLAPELKSNYTPIFEDAQTPQSSASAIFNVIRSNPTLSQCSTLGLG